MVEKRKVWDTCLNKKENNSTNFVVQFFDLKLNFVAKIGHDWHKLLNYVHLLLAIIDGRIFKKASIIAVIVNYSRVNYRIHPFCVNLMNMLFRHGISPNGGKFFLGKFSLFCQRIMFTVYCLQVRHMQTKIASKNQSHLKIA